MKIKALAISAISIALLASCSGNSGKSALNDKSSATDSLSYTFGELAAMQRAVTFEQDTTLRGDDARKDFDNGFNDGLKLLKEGKDGYNAGLVLGLNFAMQMQDMAKNQGIEINRNIMLSGYNTNAKDSVDPQAFQKIQERGARLISSIMGEKVKGKVEELAKKGKYQKNNDLYYLVNHAGSGANLTNGQEAVLRINIMDKNRKELMPQLKEQQTPYTVGSGYIPALEKVLPLMSQGAAYEILVAPQQVFGPNTPPMVDQKEPVILTVEVVSLAKDSVAMEVPATSSTPAPAPAK